ncbi:uridylate kinase [Planctomycetales bacterium]|nr:uridylate kinase [Planctomycetales bacterium]
MANYRRVMLKLSGEALGGEKGVGLDQQAIRRIADEVAETAKAGVEVAVVIGGGNFLRGNQITSLGIERGTGDYMGMMATVINALALQSVIENIGMPTRVLSALQSPMVAEAYIRRRAIRHLEKGRVVILAGGTGNPYFTTDTAAALRAVELGCEVLLKATKVDGIYTADPLKVSTAKKYDALTYDDCLAQHLQVMDATAFTMCRENNLAIAVYSLKQAGATLRLINGEALGTKVVAKI